jgi:hypothetical protein
MAPSKIPGMMYQALCAVAGITEVAIIPDKVPETLTSINIFPPKIFFIRGDNIETDD